MSSQNQPPELPRTVHDPFHNVTYHPGKLLGKGGFASVYEFEEMATRISYACKITSRASLQKKKYYDKFVSEVKIHRNLSHSNIVKVINVFKDDLNYYIILDKCAGGTLTDIIRNRKHLTETETRYFTLQILSALSYLHQLLIIHRDIKTSNIFLTQDFQVKLGDFGLAVQCESKNECRFTMCGTPNFLPVEVIASHIRRRKEANKEPDPNLDADCILLCEKTLPEVCSQGHSFASDLWSLGCMVYAMIYARPPFESSDIKSTYKRILKCDYSFPSSSAFSVSDDFKDFIRRLLVVDPTRRLSVDECFAHPWLDTNKYFVPKVLPPSVLTEPFSVTSNVPGGQILINAGLDLPRAIGKADYSPAFVGRGGPGGPANVPGSALGGPRGLNMHAGGLGGLGGLGGAGPLGASGVPSINKYGVNESEFPQSPPPVYVISWVDYSNRYGFAYQFSNGSIGVLFNDESVCILSPNARIVDYRESPAVLFANQNAAGGETDAASNEGAKGAKDGGAGALGGMGALEFVRCLFDAGKARLPEKKYKLLVYFKEYLENRSIQPIPQDKRPTDDVLLHEKMLGLPEDERDFKRHTLVPTAGLAFPQIYIKKWKLAEDSTLCLLYNTKIFQVNFPDHTKVIVAHKSVSFINEKREVLTYSSDYLKNERFAFRELRDRVDKARKHYELIKLDHK